MKKEIKMLAVSSILVTSIFAQKSIKAVTENINYTLKVNTHYEVLTDEGTFTIPDSYTFTSEDDDSTYELKLTNLQNLAQTLSQTNGYKSLVTYDATTKELTSKAGYYVTATGNYDNLLLNEDASVTDYTDATTREKLIRITEKNLILKSKNSLLSKYQTAVSTETSENQITFYNSVIEDYEADIERMEALDVSDISTERKLYNALIHANAVSNITPSYDKDTYKHNYDDITVAYNYYVILVRDLRLNELNYTVNGQTTAVSNFDKDTKSYNVYLPAYTAKNATITTSSTSYQTVTDEEEGYDYDNGISIEEGNVTLNNGTGTATVTVSFDGSKYGLTDEYTKKYTVNFSVLSYQKGDVNLDGYVNSTDAALVLDCYKNGSATENDYKYGDMNEDGVLNSTDAAMILDIYKNS